MLLQMRRETERKILEDKVKIEKETLEAKAMAEGKARADLERVNEDVHRRAQAVELRHLHERAVEVAKTSIKLIGEGAYSLISDPTMALRTVVLLGGAATAVYGAREGTRLARTRLEAILGRPALVRETSRTKYTSPVSILKAAAAALRGGRKASALSDVVFAPELEQKLEQLAVATKNTKKHNAPFRHVMFYGPPGTGKTLVARQLAHYSGLDYAIMSGGDVAPLKEHAVTELHNLFKWAETSTRGLILFIDEAEAFLKTRNDPEMSEHARNALNALLYNTGTESQSFMLVLATNLPGDLDKAVADRIDEHIKFDLPDEADRIRLLKMYFRKMITNTQGITADKGIDDDFFHDVASDIDGFSGRAISKLMISAQGAAYGTETGRLSKETFINVIKEKIRQRKRQEQMIDGAMGTGGSFI